MAQWLVVGAGYTGSALVRRLVAEGHDVTATRRTAGSLALDDGTLPVRALDLAQAPPDEVPDAIIVCCAPPGADPVREMYNLVALGGRRIVYVSSTGVYAPGGGAWVDESWPLAPTTATGRARLAAEQALSRAVATVPPHAHFTAPIDGIAMLRAAGIYGPGRGLVERMRAGTYRIVGDGRAHVSRIHVADLVEAIVRAGESTATGAFNVADDDPAPIGDVADALAASLGLPPPPRVPAASVDAEVAGMLTADRRIANGRLKRELGVVLRYPSWRDALA
ncbi:MAG: NAD-dependent epimerase/dehydratase family protein [Deltaproteobacteria bacterium]|nr:NAD-dependent epimerase/dehydratase family protein [Deltaproteobacteria bacterium]